MKSLRMIALAALAALSLSACRKAPEAMDGPTPEATEEASPEARPGLSVTDGVLVLPAVRGNPGAAYFTLNNTGAETALAGIYIAGTGKAEMHESTGGTMQPLAEVPVPSKATVTFERGGKHVMVFDLADSLQPGTTTELTLTFSGGDKLSAPLKVQSAGEAATEHTESEEMEHMH